MKNTSAFVQKKRDGVGNYQEMKAELYLRVLLDRMNAPSAP